MIEGILSNIALSSPIKFIIAHKEIPSGIVFRLKNEPTKYVMFCRYRTSDSYQYKIHTYDKSKGEVDCTTFDNYIEFSKSINPENLVYDTLINNLVIDRAKKRLALLIEEKINQD